MTHYSDRLPREIEVGAIRSLKYSTDVVTTDGGREVRNARWSTPLRTYELSLPASRRDNAAYLAVINLYTKTLGGLHSFDMTDWVDESGSTVVQVRFDSELKIQGLDYRTDHIETLTLVEVR